MEANNMATIREALEVAESYLTLAAEKVRGETGKHIGSGYDDAAKKCRAALALPPRQCDVGTPYEQGNRMRQFCEKQKRNGIINCGYCPINHQYLRDCTLAWAQMPYKEGGDDGSK